MLGAAAAPPAPHNPNGEAEAAPKIQAGKSPAEAAKNLMEMMMATKGLKKKKRKQDEENCDDGESEADGESESEEAPGRAPAKLARAGQLKAGKKPEGPKVKALKGTALKSTGSKLVVPPVSQKRLPKFPGVPKANKEYPPLEYKQWRIYTAMNTSAWRCKQQGVRSDTSCSWKVDPAAGWAKVIKTITKK